MCETSLWKPSLWKMMDDAVYSMIVLMASETSLW